MPVRRIVLFAFVVGALMVSASAQAHSFSARALSDKHVGKSKPELKAQMAYSGYIVQHFRQPQHHWRLLPRHSTCWSHVQSKKLRQVCDAARTQLIRHRRLAKVAAARYAALYAPKPLPGHYAGWSCITNGAHPGAPGDPHEGNGYAGSYTGWLGMTTPWAGHYPPGSDWVHSAQADVYAIAESEAAQHGWNDTWMRGQWPNTYPPCSGFFT